MKIEVVSEIGQTDLATTAILIGVDSDGALHGGEALDESTKAATQAAVDSDLLTEKTEEAYFLPTPGGAQRGVLMVRISGERDAEPYRRAGGSAVAALRLHKISQIATAWPMLHLPVVIEGIVLGQYVFEKYLSNDSDPAPMVEKVILAGIPESIIGDVERTILIAECANFARDLGNTPSNDLTPQRIAETAEEIARDGGMKCTVLHEDELLKNGMNLLLAVARGSQERATMSIIEYKHPDAKHTIAIVGKGITFDTGGISIKPPASMHEMKFDMLGAAAVLGAMKAIGQLKPVINVIGVVPSAENMPGSDAVTPGEIVRGYNGKTVEIHNTDAEGRLILADALAYTAEKYAPDKMVDLATLTGAVIIGLGHYASSVMSDNSDIPDDLVAAGETSGDRCWRLPLWDDYTKLMKGTHADLTNACPTREAGSITAGGFLSHFHGGVPWAHVDIAGAAWGAKGISYYPKDNPTGHGVRLLCQWISSEAGE